MVLGRTTPIYLFLVFFSLLLFLCHAFLCLSIGTVQTTRWHLSSPWSRSGYPSLPVVMHSDSPTLSYGALRIWHCFSVPLVALVLVFSWSPIRVIDDVLLLHLCTSASFRNSVQCKLFFSNDGATSVRLTLPVSDATFSARFWPHESVFALPQFLMPWSISSWTRGAHVAGSRVDPAQKNPS